MRSRYLISNSKHVPNGKVHGNVLQAVRLAALRNGESNALYNITNLVSEADSGHGICVKKTLFAPLSIFAVHDMIIK